MSRFSELRREKGRKAGEAWARNEADRSDLERLQEFVDRNEMSVEDWLTLEPMAPHSHADYIAAAIVDHDDRYEGREELYEAAESIFGEDYGDRSNEWLAAFVEAALEVLHEPAVA